MAASNPRKSSAKNPIQHGFLKSATLAEPERRIFSSGKTDLKAEDDRKGDHKTRSAVRMLVASQIMKPRRSPPDLSGWIRDVCRYIRTPEVIHNAPDSSKVVAGDAYRWSIASEDHNPQRFTPQLTASISIKALPSGIRTFCQVSTLELYIFAILLNYETSSVSYICRSIVYSVFSNSKIHHY